MDIPYLKKKDFDPKDYDLVFYFNEKGRPNGDGSTLKPFRHFVDIQGKIGVTGKKVLCILGKGTFQTALMPYTKGIAIIGQGVNETTLEHKQGLFYENSTDRVKEFGRYADFTWLDNQGRTNYFKPGKYATFQNIYFKGNCPDGYGYLISDGGDDKHYDFINCLKEKATPNFFRIGTPKICDLYNCLGRFDMFSDYWQGRNGWDKVIDCDFTQPTEEQITAKLASMQQARILGANPQIDVKVNWLESELPQDLILTCTKEMEYKIQVNGFTLQEKKQVGDKIIIPQEHLRKGGNRVSVNDKIFLAYIRSAEKKEINMSLVDAHLIDTIGENGFIGICVIHKTKKELI